MSSPERSSFFPERLLLGPGPSNAPPEVLAALSRPVVGHLDPYTIEILDEIADRLRAVFRTRNRMTFAVSGTGSAGMEAALVNLLERGDEAVICVNGVFGGRMAEVAARAGAQIVRVESPWGQPIEADAVADALRQHPGAKLVAIVHAETSTGVMQDLADVAEVVAGHEALLVVDAVTSLGGIAVDADVADVCYSGSQKCLSVPPGLAPITFSQRAIDVVRSRATPVQSWYLDVTLLEGYWGSERIYHHTAPTSMLMALHAGLGVVLAEGLEARWARHARLGEVLTTELEARGFSYVAPQNARLPMLHHVRLPSGVDGSAVRERLLADHGIEVGSGLGPFAGESWRIGLMGHSCRQESIDRLTAALDEVL